mgnify:CR=1 FL=1
MIGSKSVAGLPSDARKRLSTLEEFSDLGAGFNVAMRDLDIRGPGEFLGTRQAGALPFRIADLVRDKDWLLRAREDIVELLKLDPRLENPENSAFRAYIDREGHLQGERLKTS